MMAANITGLPHSIFMTLVGKEMSNIHGYNFKFNLKLRYIQLRIN